MTAGLLSGGAAGLLLLAPSLADAASPLADAFGQTTPPTTEPAADSADDAGTTDTATDPADDAAESDLVIVEPGDQLRELLQPLVDDGTITAEQLDAVVESVQSAAPEVFVAGLPGLPGLPGRPDGQFPDVMGGGHDGPGFPGGGIEVHGGGPGISIEIGEGRGRDMLPLGPYALALVANTIGITAPDLIDQLADGSTVAEIATAAGADPQAVIDALVADAQERLAAGVQSGRITQAEADERIENLTERITSWINGEEPSADEQADDAGTEESADTATDTAADATTETTTA